jgi:hypothetical protein
MIDDQKRKIQTGAPPRPQPATPNTKPHATAQLSQPREWTPVRHPHNTKIIGRDRLGGAIHEYQQVA